MEVFKAVLLGVIEGLTEFLPVSSTGHLIVAEEMLGYYDTSRLFTVVIQTGAIAAVVWFYRRDLKELIRKALAGSRPARRFVLIWVLATVPAAVFGLLFERQIEASSVTLTVALALLAGGVIIWLVETYRRVPESKTARLEKLSVKQAVAVGFYQVLALIPGLSRSGATIIGGMLSGLDRVTATAFSFYLGIPILLLAGAYKFGAGDIASVPGGGAALLAGLASSFITAFLVVGWLLKFVSRHDLKAFAYYRIGFGIFLLALLGLGVMD